MDRKPLTTARSVWRTAAPSPDVVAILENAGADEISVAYRNVHDGSLRVLIANEPAGWHLSISHVDHHGRPRRYPTWDEIADARDVFLPATLGFVMHLPKAGEYVAVHDTTFHLHEHPHPSASSQTCTSSPSPSSPNPSAPKRERMAADEIERLRAEVAQYESFIRARNVQHVWECTEGNGCRCGLARLPLWGRS